MHLKQVGLIFTLCTLAFLGLPPVHAQEHRATRLGNPATRFADPLRTPEDLRNLLRSEALRADVVFILKESGYRGDLEDFRSAAGTNQILPLRIPVGTRLAAMSSRKNGRPVLLRDVLWAGKEPIDAYELYFASRDRRYRLVAPKACANFWVEDYGPVLRPALALACQMPAEVMAGRPAEICLTLLNTGGLVEPLAKVTLPLPAGASFVSATMGGQLKEGRVVWEWQDLAPVSRNQVCAVFTLPQTGSLSVVATAQGSRAAEVQSRCETRVTGIPAVHLEVVDLADPIEVGKEVVYEVTVLNQGTALLTNLKLSCTMESGQEFVSGTGPTEVLAQAAEITLGRLPVLAPKVRATWRLVVKCLTPGDVRFETRLICDEFQEPITETESTRQF